MKNKTKRWKEKLYAMNIKAALVSL